MYRLSLAVLGILLASTPAVANDLYYSGGTPSCFATCAGGDLGRVMFTASAISSIPSGRFTGLNLETSYIDLYEAGSAPGSDGSVTPNNPAASHTASTSFSYTQHPSSGMYLWPVAVDSSGTVVTSGDGYYSACSCPPGGTGAATCAVTSL